MYYISLNVTTRKKLIKTMTFNLFYCSTYFLTILITFLVISKAVEFQLQLQLEMEISRMQWQ